MDTDPSNGVSSTPRRVKKDLVATPVKGGASGFGLPYAPEDWPLPGDKWGWKVSRRTTSTGYYQDRFLIPPSRFPKSKIPGSKGICSKVLAELFIKREIPGASLEEFWSSFQWRIPSFCAKLDRDLRKKITLSSCTGHLVNGHIDFSPPSHDGACKVGNKMCDIRVQARKDPLPAMPCDICCSENGFCRNCSCILCGGIIDFGDGGYSFIRCKAIVENEGESFICGHIAHANCALRACLAGTVGGNVALDAEYYCRRCDNRMDLVSYFTEVLNSIKSINCRDNMEKVLCLGTFLLRGSQKPKAKELLTCVERILAKLRDGFKLEEIWKIEDNIQTVPGGEAQLMVTDETLLGIANGACNHTSLETLNELGSSGGDHSGRDGFIYSDSKTASMELENTIDSALRELKKSQESEYRLAEEKLYAQKGVLLGLYQEVEAGTTCIVDPSGLPSKDESESRINGHLCRVSQIQHEEAKLKAMMQISKGFGRSPKYVLKGLYGLQVDG